jgi:hypothetical protein
MKQTQVSNGPGRPKYQVKYPNRKFTMTDLMEKNGVNPKSGKGKFCSKLTLVKALVRDSKLGTSSEIVKLDETREPNSKSGMGRKTFVYIKRDKLNTVKTVAKSAPAKSAKVKVKTKTKVKPVTTTSDYEAQKAALLAPVPAVTITPEPTPAPAPEPEPVAVIAPEPAPAPEPEPVAVTIAPEPAPAIA